MTSNSMPAPTALARAEAQEAQDVAVGPAGVADALQHSSTVRKLLIDKDS